MITCAHCGYEFKLAFDTRKGETEKGEEKKTMTAAQANKQGPFCKLCWHLRMAGSYADARNKKAVLTLIESAITALKPGEL